MQHDARRYCGHSTLLRGFLDGEALQLHILDQTSLPLGKTLQQPVEIGAQRAFLRILGGKESAGILEGDLNRPVPAAQMIDELVAGEGICPGREGKGSVVALALQMHCKECLLNQVLDLGGAGADAACEVPAQKTTEHAEELAVRARISLETPDHQRPEALFGLILLQHQRVDSLAGARPPNSNADDRQTTNREELSTV